MVSPCSCLALLALLAASATQLALASDECYGPIVELEVSSQQSAAGSPALVQQYYGVLADVGSNLSRPLPGLRMAAAEPLTACGGQVAPAPPGTALLVVRGDCTFTDKLLAVLSAGAAAMLLYDNAPGCVTMAFEPNATDAVSPDVAVVSVPQAVGLRLAADLAAVAAAGGAGPTLSLHRVEPPLVDAGAVVLWLLAVGTVVAGAVWSGADHLAARRAAAEEQDPLLSSSPSKDLGGGVSGSEALDLTPQAALAFVVLASAMLLLLYFLLNRVFFFVLLGLFCLASVQAQTVLYAAGLQALVPRRLRQATVNLPLAGPCPLAAVLSLPVATSVAVVWAVWRRSDWAWLLQDLQGVALMLLVLRSLRVPSLRVAAVLLPACLAYDVFWVFIQPMMFGGGQSVMVEVAQGGSSGEFVPMLLRVPHFGFGGLGGSSLLGFGDIILPGTLVAFTRRVDIDLGLRYLASGGGGGWGSYLYRSYFPYAVLSYGAGLCLTYAALAFSWFGDQGQPALLYLVPCTLATVAGLAAARRQAAALWRGETATVGSGGRRDHDSDAGDGGLPTPTLAQEVVAAGAGAGAGAGGGGGARAREGDGDVEAGGAAGLGMRPGMGEAGAGVGNGGVGSGGGRSRRGGDAAAERARLLQ